MLTPSHSDLAYSSAKLYFGPNVARVVQVLFNFDQVSLGLLKSNCPNLTTKELKRALLILVKYQLVDYVKTVKNFNQRYEYYIVPQRIFSFFRLARYIQSVVNREEDQKISESVLLSVSKNGLLSKGKLEQLTRDHLERHFQQQEKSDDLKTTISSTIDFLVSKRFLAQLGKNLCLNIERFNRIHRDNLIVEAVTKYYGNERKVKSICKAILNFTLDNTSDDAAFTAPIGLMDLIALLIPYEFSTRDQLEKYLFELTNESNNKFFRTSGINPAQGIRYCIDIGSVIDYQVKEHLSSVIDTKFGPKCCRVFRVLLLKGPLLLKQIEELIMLPAKDVREYSYMLIKEGFMRNRQVPKTPDNAPGKSVFIMSVELDQVVYRVLDLSCRAINNLLIRYEHELNSNKSLLDKSREFCNLNVSQDEWNQYFTSHELSELSKTNRKLDKLLLARNQVDETLFLLHTWLTLSPNLETEHTD